MKVSERTKLIAELWKKYAYHTSDGVHLDSWMRKPSFEKVVKQLVPLTRRRLGN